MKKRRNNRLVYMLDEKVNHSHGWWILPFLLLFMELIGYYYLFGFNSNYGWMIWSKDNYEQYKHCLQKLIEDPHTREACMIYNRPSMQEEYNKNGMHDFCCTYAVQCFLNEDNSGRYHLKYIVYMRSNDAVFGFDNDALWHMHVQERLARDLFGNIPTLTEITGPIICDPIVWNAGSLHVYERHFKFLED